MGEVAIAIKAIDGKVESKVVMVEANIIDLSQVYAFLDIAKIKIMDQIKKVTKDTEGLK